jgi:uroporphyrinogen decarboxylase
MAGILLDCLSGIKTPRIPFWFMRQAGRYLPEYRELRAKAGGFLDLCYTPEFAVEVTMQPLRRFDMDAAILFSDILVIPDALGQKVSFHEGEGPRLEAMNFDMLKLISLDVMHQHLKPVYQTITELSNQLPKHKTLIGFSGAPWTLACYMIEGKSSRDYATARSYAITNEVGFDQLITVLEKAISAYLIKQVECGAEVLQLFDSWAGITSVAQFRKYVIAPTKRIVENVKKAYPNVKIIGFPKDAGVLYVDYAKQTGVDGMSVDFHTPLTWLSNQVNIPLQGNMDPLVLAGNKDHIKRDLEHKLEAMEGKPYIFNLGHGIVPHTPPEHVAFVSEYLKSWSMK